MIGVDFPSAVGELEAKLILTPGGRQEQTDSHCDGSFCIIYTGGETSLLGLSVGVSGEAPELESRGRKLTLIAMVVSSPLGPDGPQGEKQGEHTFSAGAGTPVLSYYQTLCSWCDLLAQAPLAPWSPAPIFTLAILWVSTLRTVWRAFLACEPAPLSAVLLCTEWSLSLTATLDLFEECGHLVQGPTLPPGFPTLFC